MSGKLRMTEDEWRALDDLRLHWGPFCDADPFPGADTFIDRMETAGYARLRSVKKTDIENDGFATERGIHPGGQIWVLTPKGQRALAEPTPAHSDEVQRD